MLTLSSPHPPLGLQFYELFKSQSHTDITIVADGRKIEGHKLVLVVASTYLKDIIEVIPGNHPAIVLPRIPHTFLPLIMDFIYLGRVDVKEKDAQKFQKMLKDLKIESKVYETAKEIKLEDNSDAIDDNILIEEDLSVGCGKFEPIDASENVDLGTFDLTESNQQSRKAIQAKPPILFPSQRITIESVVLNDQVKKFMAENPITCPFCWKEATSLKHRNEHVKYCRCNPNRVISKCPLCEKNFCDPYYLRKHLRLMHKTA